MSEFIEIDDHIFRRANISHVTGIKTGCAVWFVDCETGERFSEPYESVRDKLLGKASPVVDLRCEFVEQVAAVLRKRNQPVAAILVEEFYHSSMLSETEGAG